MKSNVHPKDATISCPDRLSDCPLATSNHGECPFKTASPPERQEIQAQCLKLKADMKGAAAEKESYEDALAQHDDVPSSSQTKPLRL